MNHLNNKKTSGKKIKRKNVRYIPETVKIQLWGRAAGRCQFDSCNKVLWRDDLTQTEFNIAYIAHIIADSPDGPRGDKIESPRLKKDISNLMLMCDVHHRMIDNDEHEYTVEKLKEMKAKHEDRIELVTDICPEKKSQIVLFGANIGDQNPMFNEKEAKLAITPERYPTKNAIILGTHNSEINDEDSQYWSNEVTNLERQYYQKVKERITAGEISHLSVLGLAPQPLLIKLGTLLTDITQVQVFQLHREPQTWRWKEQVGESDFLIREPKKLCELVALKISLSATISDDRVTDVLGENVSIWELTVPKPGYDIIPSKEALSDLRQVMRRLYAKIKEVHGQQLIIHVFAAMPVSAAIEFGRVRNPKADSKLVIYNQSKSKNKFVEAIQIN